MDLVLLGLSLGLGAGIAPGPLLALVLSEGLRGGFAAGARVAVAPLITDAPIVVASVLVLGRLPPGWLDGLAVAGGAFVALLGLRALVERPAVEPARVRDGLRRAVVANAASPHPWLFWATVGGPLLATHPAASGAGFLTAFYATLVAVKVTVAAAVAAGRRSLLGGRGYAIALRASGLVLLAAGGALVAEGL